MQNRDTTSSGVQESSSKPTRERVGLVVNGANASTAVSTIVAAEASGILLISTWFVVDYSEKIDDLKKDTNAVLAAALVPSKAKK